MGCIHSRNDINDLHPNEFYVINIDDLGNALGSGHLEVTDHELILNRRGKEPTLWPLRSLRRYGFDGDVFSFESGKMSCAINIQQKSFFINCRSVSPGRRCATGEGIYAFKCRRAEQLFNTLLRCIHSRNHNNESVLESFSSEPTSCPPGTLPRPLPDSFNLVPSHSQSDYLEPAPPANFPQNSRFPGLSNVRLGSVSSGPLSPEVHSPGSPSSVNILEVMPLAPLPQAGAQVTNVYQMHDFPQPREHNNNKKFKLDSITHSYSNTGDVNTDLVSLRPSLQAQKFIPCDDEHISNMLNEQNVAGETVPLSPTLSTTSEAYATLNMLDMNNRLYMNLPPGEGSNALPSIREETSNHSNFQNFSLMNNLQTPKTNFNFADLSKIEIDEEKHNYANLGPGEVNYDPRLLQKNKNTRGIILDNNMPDANQDATIKINYAVLDLDKANDDASDGILGLPPSSPKKPAVGYTIIDFNKTEALTSVALGTEVDMEGSRKTRHNSTALPPSPTT